MTDTAQDIKRSGLLHWHAKRLKWSCLTNCLACVLVGTLLGGLLIRTPKPRWYSALGYGILGKRLENEAITSQLSFGGQGFLAIELETGKSHEYYSLAPSLQFNSLIFHQLADQGRLAVYEGTFQDPNRGVRGSNDKFYVVFDTANGKELHHIPKVNSTLTTSRDTPFALELKRNPMTENTRVIEWDLRTGAQRETSLLFPCDGFAVSLSPDERFLGYADSSREMVVTGLGPEGQILVDYYAADYFVIYDLKNNRESLRLHSETDADKGIETKWETYYHDQSLVLLEKLNRKSIEDAKFSPPPDVQSHAQRFQWNEGKYIKEGETFAHSTNTCYFTSPFLITAHAYPLASWRTYLHGLFGLPERYFTVELLNPLTGKLIQQFVLHDGLRGFSRTASNKEGTILVTTGGPSGARGWDIPTEWLKHYAYHGAGIGLIACLPIMLYFYWKWRKVSRMLRM